MSQLVRDTLLLIDGFHADRDPSRLHEVVELREMGTGLVLRGRAQVGAWMRRFYECLEGARDEEVLFTVDAGRGVVESVVAGKHVRSLAGETPSGLEVRVATACAYEIDEGLIRGLRLYVDARALLVAAPPGPAPAHIRR
jgi:hypothetical protein